MANEMAMRKETLERMEEINSVKRIDKDKAVKLFFAFIRDFPQPVKMIVLHYAFHFEEVVAYMLYKKCGAKFFPGIEDATVEIWGEGRMLSEYIKGGLTDLDLLVGKGILIIGAANSLTDEHGTSSFPSAAHLAVELLGLSESPLTRKILKFCEQVDNSPNSNWEDPHSWMKRAHIRNKYKSGEDGNKELEWTLKLLDFMIYWIDVDLWDQLRFLECEEEFIEKGKTFKWVNPVHSEDTVEIVAIESDNHAMARFVRNVWNESNRKMKKLRSAVIPDIYIQQGKAKNTVVFFSPRLLQKLKLSGVDIKDFVRVLRIVELKESRLIYDSLSESWLALDEQGRVKLCLRWQDLEAPLDSEFCPSWYHSTKGNQLLSRSLTAPEMPETKLNVWQIAGAVASALTPLINPCGATKENRVEDCRVCRFYRLGFVSCRTKQFEMRQNNQKILSATGTNGG